MGPWRRKEESPSPVPPPSGIEGGHTEAFLQGPLTPGVGDRTPACVLESERDRGGGACGEQLGVRRGENQAESSQML